MKILFVHQNFPGQFLHIAPKLTAIGHDVKAFVLRDVKAAYWNGIEIIPYSLMRGNTQGIDKNLVDLESKLIRGYGCQRAARRGRGHRDAFDSRLAQRLEERTIGDWAPR